MDGAYEVAIVGAGPAGLAAAEALGRARRRTLLIENKTYRNGSAGEIHGYLTREGVSPQSFLQLGLKEVTDYPTVFGVEATVDQIFFDEDAFRLQASCDGSTAVYEARKIILATGLRDRIADIRGLPALYGRAVFHCPLCHGYELHGLRIAVIGHQERHAHQALYVSRRISKHVVLCSNGPLQVTVATRDKLRQAAVEVYEHPICAVTGGLGHLVLSCESVDLPDQDAAFHYGDIEQHSDLAVSLGCALLQDGRVKVDSFQATSVPGIWAAGDMAREESTLGRMTFVAISVASGLKAGVVVDETLFEEDLLNEDADRLDGPS